MAKREILSLKNRIDGQTEKELIEKILKQREEWIDYYSINNANYHADSTFLYDSQFSAEEESAYEADERPALQANLLYKVSSQLDAEFSTNTFAPKVRPMNDILDPKMLQDAIDIRQNMLNYIDNLSTSWPKKRAFAQAKDGGYSSVGLYIEPDPTNPFQFVIKHKATHNPTLDFWDASARAADRFKQDGQFCGTHTLLSKAKAKELYPNLELESIPRLSEDYTFSWEREQDLWFIDYWMKVPSPRKVARLTSGQVIPIDDEEASNVSEGLARNNRLGLLHQPIAIQRGMQRFFILETHTDNTAFKIKHYRLAANTVVESKDWPGTFLPRCFIPGNTKFLGDREKTISLIYFAKDAQRFHNFILNEIALRFKLSRYEPFLLLPEMVDGLEKMWSNNAQPKNALFYKLGYDKKGNAILPQRQVPSEPPQSLFNQQAFSEHLIQAVSGRFDASFGAPSNEQSGIAIANRSVNSISSSKLYFDNFKSAWEIVLQAELDMMKHIFDNNRKLPLPDDKGNIKFININNPNQPASDLRMGDFTVNIEMGNSYEIQKQQNLGLLNQITTAYPALIPYTIDLLLENLDIPNASKLVDRVRSSGIVNPQVILNESNNPRELQTAQKNLMSAQQKEQQNQALLQTQLQLAQQRVANESTRAHADQMRATSSSVADLQNAQTNRLNAMLKGAASSDKVKAERERTMFELQKAAFEASKAAEVAATGRTAL